MSDLTSGASTQDLIALAVSGVIFLITIVLVARQAVNFLITVIFLFLTLVSGFALANNNIVRQKFETPETQRSLDATLKAPQNQAGASTLEQIKVRVLQLFEQLVELLSNNSNSSAPASPQKQAKAHELMHDIEAKMATLQSLLESSKDNLVKTD